MLVLIQGFSATTPVRRERRRFSIPTIRDRVAQMAAVLVLAPIYEADLAAEQYAYRPGRGALHDIRVYAPAGACLVRGGSPYPSRLAVRI